MQGDWFPFLMAEDILKEVEKHKLQILKNTFQCIPGKGQYHFGRSYDSILKSLLH